MVNILDNTNNIQFVIQIERQYMAQIGNMVGIQGKQRRPEEVENSINWVLKIRPCDDA